MKAREINCAVLIVGAGLSGIAAAVAASRKGVQTLLLEQNAFTEERLSPGCTGICADYILTRDPRR